MILSTLEAFVLDTISHLYFSWKQLARFELSESQSHKCVSKHWCQISRMPFRRPFLSRLFKIHFSRIWILLLDLLTFQRSASISPIEPLKVFESLHRTPQGWTQLERPDPEPPLHLRIAVHMPAHDFFEKTLYQVSIHTRPSKLRPKSQPRRSQSFRQA